MNIDISARLIHGSSVVQNTPPILNYGAKIRLSGKFKGKPSSFALDDDILSKHTLLIGNTGCGKTTLLYHFISQLKQKMTADDVMIIFDSKGDFYSRFFNCAKDLVIGNSKQYLADSQRWNIYKEILADGRDERDFIINAQEICKSFFEERTKNTTNAFFPNAARDLLAAIITAFIREGKQDRSVSKKYFYNNELRKFLEYSDPQIIMDFLENSPDASAVLSYISGDNAQSQGVLSEMYSIIREIFIGVFAEKGVFSMREFVRRRGGRTIFIEYDLSIGSMLIPVYRLLFDLALKEALGRNSGGNAHGNVYFICDEFRLLPYLQHIDDGVNFGRSLGVKVFAGIQSIEQLFEIYGQSRGKNIAAGFSSVYAFRANDVSTRDYIKGLFGKNIILEQYQKLGNRLVEEKRNGYTVEDWNINCLGIGEAVVCLPFSVPFIFKFDSF